MITYYSVLLILATAGVRCQYDLKEYAPEHNNYESYSFAYGVSDAHSGDHKHQWERMEHGYVQGEYGLVEPDGMMRLVQYTAGPKEGFQAKVSKVAVDVAKPEVTQGKGLYQGEHEGARYAPADTSHLEPDQNQYQESNIGNAQPEYTLDYGQKVNPENDYANEESQPHVIISRALTNRTRTPNRAQKDQSNKRKQVVKKNIENEMHALQPGLTGGMDYISNFNLNPINIHQLNIPDAEKQILQGLQTTQQLVVPVHNPQQFSSPHIQNTANPNLNPGIHPALLQFQQQIGNSQMNGYQITPSGAALINHQTVNHQPLPLVQRNPVQQYQQSLPTSIQDVKSQQGILDSGYGDQRLQQALSSIHNHPEINTRLRVLHNQHNIPQQVEEQHPRIVNQQIPVQKEYGPVYQTDYEQYQQNIRDGTYGSQITNDFNQYQQNIREGTYGQTNLSTQNQYPLILVDPQAKLGLPFYPSSYDIHSIPHEEFNYEGIPYVEGRRSNNENQTVEEKIRERQYLLGLTPGPQFPPPKGYTRETIWQAGDPDGDPQLEILPRQLNETCAYIQWNETTPGNEDGRPNIWQAGDYSAQNEEEELIRSVNITCENYTTDAMADFSSGYTIIDYCYQCVKNDGSYYTIDENGQTIVPSYIPHRYGLSDEQQDHADSQQNQQNYETSVEGYGQQQSANDYRQQQSANDYGQQQSANDYGQQQSANDAPQNYDTQGNYQQGPTKMVIYPNYGYRNDPQNGLYRRRNTKRRVENVENVTERKKA